MTRQPNMNHFVKHWLSNPAPPRHVPWFERDVRRPPPGWIMHLRTIPPVVPNVAGPQDRGRGRGHHDLNLEHQLEARARVSDEMLTWREWISLSPYVRLTDQGGFTWDHNDRAGVNDGLYEAWLDVWFGHHGAVQAIELRQSVMDAIEATVDLQRVPWSRMNNTEAQQEQIATSQSHVAEAWKASGGFMRGVVATLEGRVWVDAKHRVRILGESSLVWVLTRHSSASRGQEYGVRVHLEGTGHVPCIQPKGPRVHGFDILTTYMMSMANDRKTSFEVSTLSNGLVKEQRMVNEPQNLESPANGMFEWPPASFARPPPRWMSNTQWTPLTLADFDRMG
jgi:hypothetical protein